MLAICMFLEIIIYMCTDDHNPPHFHAKYQEYNGIFDLEGNMLEGNIPSKQQKFIALWTMLRHKELEANWHIANEHGKLFPIAPLK